MDKSLLIGGFGGQGVQTMGKLLAYAGNDAELNVTYYPAYGAEMRGGTSNGTLVVSDKRIGSPSRRLCDYVVVLNAPSFVKFEPRVKPGGVLFVNSSLISETSERTDITVVNIPLNDLVKPLGTTKALNVIMYGFFVAYTGLIPVEIAAATLRERLGYKAEYAELNRKAFDIGVEYAKGLLTSKPA